MGYIEFSAKGSREAFHSDDPVTRDFCLEALGTYFRREYIGQDTVRITLEAPENGFGRVAFVQTLRDFAGVLNAGLDSGSNFQYIYSMPEPPEKKQPTLSIVE